MKVVLAAIEKEQSATAALFSLVSYVHMTQRKTRVDVIIFPARRFASYGEKERSSLLKIAKQHQVLIGVGFYENRLDVYRLFAPDGQEFILGDKPLLLSVSHRKLYFSLRNNFPKNDVPAIKIGIRKGLAGSVLKKSYPLRETYYLGSSQPGAYEALVFQAGKVKCRLPGDHPNLLVKSVPVSEDEQ